MAHHVKHDTIVVVRLAYQEACEVANFEKIEMGSKNHIPFPFGPHLFESRAIMIWLLASDTDISMVSITHACSCSGMW